MGKMLKSKSFWLAAFLLAAIIFAFGINQSKVYQAEVKILILPKNEITASNMDQIIENAKEIPTALSFYDKLVELNPEIASEPLNLSDKDRRDTWNARISVRRVGSSGMIVVSAFSADQSQAEIISSRTASDLLVVLGKYYNAQAGIDARIIDGPIVYQMAKANFAKWIFIGLLSGLVISLLVFSLTFYLKRKFEEAGPIEIPLSLSSLKKYEFGKPAQPEMPTKKAVAPDNLPIIEEPIISEMPEMADQFIEEKENIPREATAEESKERLKKLLKREATPEEVKERLNKLLQGNL